MTYNGWTNYATWRIHLECFDGMEEVISPDALREGVEMLIAESSTEGLARDYAMAFLDDVNWQEIANHILDRFVENRVWHLKNNPDELPEEYRNEDGSYRIPSDEVLKDLVEEGY